MRQIKFRGMSLNGWVYGHYVLIESGGAPATPCIWNITSNEGVPIEHKTLGQFTGQVDMLGNDIYEGDIMETLCFYRGSYEIEHIRVLWDEYWSSFYPFTNENVRPETFVVSGNTYENPEIKLFN